MKQTLKFSTTMVFLLTSMLMMGEESPKISQKENAKDNTQLTCFQFDDSQRERINEREDPAPIFFERGEKVYVSLKNPSLEAIKIKIRDGLGRLIYSETIANTDDLSKVFNFKKAYQGSYVIKITSGANTFSREVTVS